MGEKSCRIRTNEMKDTLRIHGAGTEKCIKPLRIRWAVMQKERQKKIAVAIIEGIRKRGKPRKNGEARLKMI
jgi:hypothetical protein